MDEPGETPSEKGESADETVETTDGATEEVAAEGEAKLDDEAVAAEESSQFGDDEDAIPAPVADESE